jgi:DNA polymerase I-like protein with 3'-5' exonuclease and polymerase domains
VAIQRSQKAPQIRALLAKAIKPEREELNAANKPFEAVGANLIKIAMLK